MKEALFEPDDDEFTEKCKRWFDGAEKVAMACCEAGYPCTYQPKAPGVLGLLTFSGRIPPEEVLLKAGALAGIQDLIEEAFTASPNAPAGTPQWVDPVDVVRFGRIGNWP